MLLQKTEMLCHDRLRLQQKLVACAARHRSITYGNQGCLLTTMLIHKTMVLCHDHLRIQQKLVFTIGGSLFESKGILFESKGTASAVIVPSRSPIIVQCRRATCVVTTATTTRRSGGGDGRRRQVDGVAGQRVSTAIGEAASAAANMLIDLQGSRGIGPGKASATRSTAMDDIWCRCGSRDGWCIHTAGRDVITRGTGRAIISWDDCRTLGGRLSGVEVTKVCTQSTGLTTVRRNQQLSAGTIID